MSVRTKKNAENRHAVFQSERKSRDYSSGASDMMIAEDGNREYRAGLYDKCEQSRTVRARIELSDACAQYLEYRGKGKKPWAAAAASSSAGYSRALQGVKKFQGRSNEAKPDTVVHALDVVYLDEINTKNVKELVGARRAEGCADQTIKHEIAFLRKVVRHFKDRGFDANADFEIPDLKLAPRRERIITDEEVEEMREALSGNQDHIDFFNVLYHTGLRMMEAARLSFGDIDWENRKVAVNRYKTSETSDIYMTEMVFEILQRRFNDSERHHVYVFTDKTGKKHRLNSNSWWRIAIAKTSLNHPDKLDRDMYPHNHGEKVTPHHIRHLYASKLARSGRFTLEEIGEMLNHKDVRSTARYVKLMPRTNAMKAADVFDVMG